MCTGRTASQGEEERQAASAAQYLAISQSLLYAQPSHQGDNPAMYAEPPPSRYGYVAPYATPQPPPRPKKKDYSSRAIIVVACIFVSLLVAIILWDIAHPPSAAELKQIEVQNEQREKQEEARKQEQAKLDDKKMVASLGAYTLKSSMRNPASFQLIKVFAMPNGAYCYEYRAQNGFGGMNVELSVLTPKGNMTENTGTYNKYCVGTGLDLTAFAEK